MSDGLIHFQCPSCNAQHWRGMLDGVSLFRCFGCLYQGHGFHADLEIDREVYRDHCESNLHLRSLGLPEVPMGVDPMSHGA